MLIGGFYHVDPELISKEPETRDFSLRCDVAGQYQRKIYTGNGRTATSYILLNALRLTEEDVILLPDYLCVSVINSLEVCPAKFRFYRVKRDLTVDLEDLESKIDENVKVLYVIHYFGVPQPEAVAKKCLALCRERNLVLIEDLTQTLYTVEEGRIGFGDYLVASTRKWMPVTDGGLLAVKDGVPCPMVSLGGAYDEAVYRQLLISVMRDYYDAHPEADMSYYLQLEREANRARYLDFTPRAMTEPSGRTLFNLNHEESILRRRENYTYLYEHLRDVEGLTLAGGPLDQEKKYVPFGFVVLVENRDDFYEYLAKNRIVGEIQWILPEEYYTPGEDARYLSEHNVMLQCDQRYGKKEMAFVADKIKEYFRR